MSKVDWDNAPVDAEFFARDKFRKVDIEDKRYCKCWDDLNKLWFSSAYTLLECREAVDYEVRPVGNDPVCTPEATLDVTTEALNKTISQVELLHKRYKTSVDFLNIVKDIQVERGAEYEQEEGERSFEKIATVFNVYRGKDLLPSDIALILEIMKNVRFYAQDRYHLDSVIDKVSYGSLWAELVTQERA